MNNIDEIMSLIDWNRSESDQLNGIRMAEDIKCIKAFFQPSCKDYSKNVWDNCATIICKRSDDELNYYIDDMLLWIRDLNWPGAEQIQERLIQFQDVQYLTMWLNSFVPALKKLNEDRWLFFIAPLLDNAALAEKLKPETYEILQMHRKL